MKIDIQNWWKAKIWATKDTSASGLSPEETIKHYGHITICTILIANKVVGCVNWDGKELSISKELVEPQKIKWWCERCGRSGIIEYAEDAGVWEVFQKIRDAHNAKVGSGCSFDRYAVRVSFFQSKTKK